MILLYNTLTKAKEVFKTRPKTKIKIYSCGPTVYDFAHLGNFRAYLLTDTLVRFLRFCQLRPYLVMNITDIDDKTILGAQKAGETLAQFTQRYTAAFFEDLQKLNILPASFYPRATENIQEIQDLIIKLYHKGFAYERAGSVYFRVKNFPQYGRLSQIVLNQQKQYSRVDQDNYQKDSPGDFALWKKAKEGEPQWILKIGDKELPGRPGWHIECSAMAQRYLGLPLDIHLGGVDLIFPHHENEIAQSEAAEGKPFAKFFLHNEHLLVEGQKMSKSLGNFYTLRDLIKRGYAPLAFRYLCLQTHYRSKMNFTWEALKAAENSLKEIRFFLQREKDKKLPKKNFVQYQQKIIAALEDDLDTPRALGLLHQANAFDLWLAFDAVLGLNLTAALADASYPEEVMELVRQREKLRKEGQFKEADKIREKIGHLGYLVEDTPQGTRLIKR